MSQQPPEKSYQSTLVRLPLLIFMALGLLFAFRLFAGDPAWVPSVLINKPVPVFDLPALPLLSRDGVAVPGFATADLAKGKVSIVNLFASWCGPCREEHPQLLEIAKDSRIQLLGFNVKDEPENARRFLAALGNPYAAVGTDRSGKAAIDWGYFGVPETFIITTDGKIAYKKVGPISKADIEREIMPEVEKVLKSKP